MQLKPLSALAGLAILAAPLASAQDPANLAFKPKVGASWTIEEHRSLATNQSGRPPSAQLELSATLKIVGGTRGGWTYEWKIESLDGGSFPVGADNPYPGLMTGVPVRFSTDNAGMPLRIEDSKDLLTGMTSTASVLPDPAYKTFAGTLGKQLSAMDAKELASTLLAQARLIASCQNLNFPTDAPLAGSGMTPTSDGPAIKTSIITKLETSGSETQPAQVHIVEATEAAPDATFSRKADIVCHINRKTGEVVDLRSDIMTNAGTFKKRDVRQISLTRDK